MKSEDPVLKQLASLGRRARHRSRLRALLLAIAVSSIVLIVAIVSTHLQAVGFAVAVTRILVLGLGGWAIYAWWSSRQLLEPTQQALLAESMAPGLGSVASTAVALAAAGTRVLRATEISRSQPQVESQDHAVTHSEALAEAHYQHAQRQLAATPLADALRRHYPHRRLVFTSSAAAGALLLLALALPQARNRLLQGIAVGGHTVVSHKALAGDISILYRYPDYTGMPERRQDGSDGSISAVTGTQVRIETTFDRSVRQARLRFTSQDQEASLVPATLLSDRRGRVELSILRAGSYSFEIQADGAGWIRDSRVHPITPLADGYPSINMNQPRGDLELSEGEPVRIRWSARDDFGIQEVALVVQGGEGDEASVLPIAVDNKTEARRQGQYTWRPGDANLGHDGEVQFYLRVTDNDVISGPKVGTSISYRLILKNAQRVHEAILARQREVLDRLIDWLADELTLPPKSVPHRAIIEQMESLGHVLLALVAAMEEDSLSPPALRVAMQELQNFISQSKAARRKALAAFEASASSPNTAPPSDLKTLQSAQTRKLESKIIYLDDLLAADHLKGLHASAGDLLQSQRELRELFAAYQASGDDPARAALKRKIEQIKNEMMRLFQQMAKARKELPGEYRNVEASQFRSLGDQLKRLETLIASDNLDEAAQELEQLENQLENMVAALEEAEADYGDERYQEENEAVQDFENDFWALESEQQQLAEQAAQMLETYRERASGRHGQKLEAILEQVQEHLDKAHQAVDSLGAGALPIVQRPTERIRQGLLDTEGLLQHQHIAEARSQLERAQEYAAKLESRLEAMNRAAPTSLPQANPIRKAQQDANTLRQEVDAARAALEELFPPPGKVLQPSEKKQLKEMAQRQHDLERRTQNLKDRRRGAESDDPMLGPEQRGQMEQAAKQMQQAAGAMGGEMLGAASARSRNAAKQLQRLRQSLEQGGSGRPQHGGVPLPLAGSSRPRPGGRRAGGRGLDRQDVEIPQAAADKSPRFRRDLLETAKQKAPRRYEEAVRQYYEELIK